MRQGYHKSLWLHVDRFPAAVLRDAFAPLGDNPQLWSSFYESRSSVGSFFSLSQLAANFDRANQIPSQTFDFSRRELIDEFCLRFAADALSQPQK
jgi:hypothetical protein